MKLLLGIFLLKTWTFTSEVSWLIAFIAHDLLLVRSSFIRRFSMFKSLRTSEASELPLLALPELIYSSGDHGQFIFFFRFRFFRIFFFGLKSVSAFLDIRF